MLDKTFILASPMKTMILLIKPLPFIVSTNNSAKKIAWYFGSFTAFRNSINMVKSFISYSSISVWKQLFLSRINLVISKTWLTLNLLNLLKLFYPIRPRPCREKFYTSSKFHSFKNLKLKTKAKNEGAEVLHIFSFRCHFSNTINKRPLSSWIIHSKF